MARVGGPVAVATGGLALSTSVAFRTSATRLWRKGAAHDLGEGPRAWLAAIVGHVTRRRSQAVNAQVLRR